MVSCTSHRMLGGSCSQEVVLNFQGLKTNFFCSLLVKNRRYIFFRGGDRRMLPIAISFCPPVPYIYLTTFLRHLLLCTILPLLILVLILAAAIMVGYLFSMPPCLILACTTTGYFPTEITLTIRYSEYPIGLLKCIGCNITHLQQ